jgi:hypothetical protein
MYQYYFANSLSAEGKGATRNQSSGVSCCQNPDKSRYVSCMGPVQSNITDLGSWPLNPTDAAKKHHM